MMMSEDAALTQRDASQCVTAASLLPECLRAPYTPRLDTLMRACTHPHTQIKVYELIERGNVHLIAPPSFEAGTAFLDAAWLPPE